MGLAAWEYVGCVSHASGLPGADNDEAASDADKSEASIAALGVVWYIVKVGRSSLDGGGCGAHASGLPGANSDEDWTNASDADKSETSIAALVGTTASVAEKSGAGIAALA